MNPKSKYVKTKHLGIFKYLPTERYQARKKIKGKNYRATFRNISEAIHWRHTFNGVSDVISGSSYKNSCSTLGYVWSRFQKLHFPSLRPQTQLKMIQQYRLLKEVEHLEMHEINTTLLSEWIIKKAEMFKMMQKTGRGSGVQARCSMNTELKILRQLFHWYKEEAEFDNESRNVFCPVKKRHYKIGKIKNIKKKNKNIPPKDALLLFNELEPLYRDLTLIQYYCAGRIGETLGIQKSSIDFNKNIVNIDHASIFNSGKSFWYLSELTKTGEERKVHINDSLKQALVSRIKDGNDESDFLFQLNGKPMNYGTVLNRYNRALKKLNLPFTGTHILRYGCASLSRTLGGSLDAAMAMTGHKDSRVAAGYAELDDHIKIDTSRKVEEHLNNLRNSSLKGVEN